MSAACLFVCLYSYLAQILNETLRWAVVAPYAARVQDTDIVIAGHDIPAGVHLLYTYYFATQSTLLVLILPWILSDHTACSVLGYWRDSGVRPSVMLCLVDYSKSV